MDLVEFYLIVVQKFIIMLILFFEWLEAFQQLNCL